MTARHIRPYRFATEAERRRCQSNDEGVRGDCDAGLWKPSVFLGIATLVFGVAFFVGTM